SLWPEEHSPCVSGALGIVGTDNHHDQELLMSTYLVTGAGPVGATVAQQLAERGETVRLATRSGSGPEHERIHRIRLDVNETTALARAVEGVTAVFHAIHGSKYQAAAWRAELPGAERAVMDAAAAVGAV